MATPQVNKLHALTGHNDCVYSLEPSPVKQQFFSAAGDGMVVLWDQQAPDTGQLIARLPNSIYALHHHAASNLLIAGHNYEGIHVLDWENKKEVGSLQLTTAAVFDIKSHDDMLFVAGGDGLVKKISLTSLHVLTTTTPAEKSARCMAIHAIRGELAVGYSDNYIRVYNLDDLTLKYAWPAHSNSVFTLAFDPAGKYLLSGSRDARLKAWDSTAGYTLAGEVVAHLFSINHLDFSPDGKHFVTCSMDKSLKVWNFEELKLVKVIDRARHAGHATSINKVLWSDWNNQLVSASDDRTISIWNIIF